MRDLTRPVILVVQFLCYTQDQIKWRSVCLDVWLYHPWGHPEGRYVFDSFEFTRL